MLVDILRKNGVEDGGVLFDAHARTALAFVTLKHDGEREFMFYRNPSADMLLEESELNLNLITCAKIFHYGSISLISEPCRSAHLAAMRAAKKAGILLSYDPNVRLPLWPSAEAAREGIQSIWKEADLIKVSDDEVAFLTQGDPQSEDVVLSLWHDGLKLLVVTDGEKGCRYFTKVRRPRSSPPSLSSSSPSLSLHLLRRISRGGYPGSPSRPWTPPGPGTPSWGPCWSPSPRTRISSTWVLSTQTLKLPHFYTTWLGLAL